MVVRKSYTFLKKEGFCAGVNGNRELWLAHSHSEKVREVNYANEIFQKKPI